MNNITLFTTTVFEDYNWTPLAMVGATLTVMGNVIMFWQPKTSRVIHEGSAHQ